MSSNKNKNEKRILIVDDDAIIRTLACEHLQKAGYIVDQAADAEFITEKIIANPPDLILMDILMPGIDGLTACQIIKEHEEWQHIPIIILTVLNDYKSIERAHAVGADDFATKPVDWKSLLYRIRYLLKNNNDAKQLKSMIEKLRINETCSTNAQHIANFGSWQWDTATDQMHWSEGVYHIFNLHRSNTTIFLKDFLAHIHPDDKSIVKYTLRRAAANQTSGEIQHRILSKDKSERFVQQHFKITNNSNQQTIITGSIQDITERKQSEDRMYYLANFDNLTKLPNRQQFKEYVKRKIRESRRYSQKLAILFIDLDNFKQINDTLGHNIGDILLKEIAQRISDSCRNSDFVVQESIIGNNIMTARYGGDEFTILLPNISKTVDVARIAGRILGNIKRTLMVDGKKIHASASIGISIFPDDGDDIETLLKNSDAAMYHAKSSGRSVYHFYSHIMNDKTSEKLTIETELKNALKNEQIILNYQPKIDLISNEITGFEALMRWQHPQRGIIMPDEFIEIGEESGVIVDFSHWVFHQACQQLRNWSLTGIEKMKMCINLSSKQFKDPALITKIDEAVKKNRIPHESLEVEITEQTLMEDTNRSLIILQRLKNHGISIAIDNFGTVYSSFGQLKDLPIDRVKIDRTFISKITIDERTEALIKAMIDLSHNLGFSVIATGVESKEQIKFLKKYHCDEAQGFLISHPVHSIEVARKFMKAK